MMLTRDRNVLVPPWLLGPRKSFPATCRWGSAFMGSHTADSPLGVPSRRGSHFKAPDTSPHFRDMEVLQSQGCFLAQRGFGKGTKLRNPPLLLLGSQPPPTPKGVMYYISGPRGHPEQGDSWNGRAQTPEVSIVQPLQFQQGSTLGKLVNCQSPETSVSGKMNSGFDMEVAKAEVVIALLKGWRASPSPRGLPLLHPQSD